MRFLSLLGLESLEELPLPPAATPEELQSHASG
jgi:hypothetical protein